MITPRRSLIAATPTLLAVALVGLLPAPAAAQSVAFRNECRVSVIVQSATVIKGRVVTDQPCLLRAGEFTPKLKLDADKIITVYDAKTNAVLFRDVLKIVKMDLGFGIQPDPKQPNKVRLTPRKAGEGMGVGMPVKPD